MFTAVCISRWRRHINYLTFTYSLHMNNVFLLSFSTYGRFFFCMAFVLIMYSSALESFDLLISFFFAYWLRQFHFGSFLVDFLHFFLFSRCSSQLILKTKYSNGQTKAPMRSGQLKIAISPPQQRH